MSRVSSAANQSRAVLSVLQRENPGKVITDSYLLLMKSLQQTTTSITWDVLTNQSTPTCIEQRLNLSDKFVVRDWAYATMMTAMAGAAPTNAEISVGIPWTYNNPQATPFGFGPVVGPLIGAIYNGTIDVTINSLVYYRKFPVRNFYRVPVSQAGTAVSTQATTGVVQRDGWNDLNFAFSPVMPTFTLDGLGSNQIVMTLPNPTATSAAATFANFACLYMRGFLIQNVNQKSRNSLLRNN